MKLKIMQAGEEVLRLQARDLTLSEIKSVAIQNLIDLMVDTMRDASGVGIAAPQVGEPLRIIAVEDRKEYHKKVSKELLRAQERKPVSLKIVINPILSIEQGEYIEHFEGCLSIEGYRAVVPRARRINISGLDRQGKKVTYDTEGWLARIFQHEVSHLDGNLYIDEMYSKTFMTEKAYSKRLADKSLTSLKEFISKSR